MADTLEAALSGLQLSTEMAKQISDRVFVRNNKGFIQQFVTMPFTNKVLRHIRREIYDCYKVVLLWPEQVNEEYWDADYNFDWRSGARPDRWYSIFDVPLLFDEPLENPNLYASVCIVHRANEPHITINMYRRN